MALKEIINEKDGNNIEAIIFSRVKRHIFMLYPFADVQPRVISIINEPGYTDGIYIFLVSECIDLVMRIPEEHLLKMIAQEFYNPFYENQLRQILKSYIEQTEQYKKDIKSGVRIANNKQKPCLYVYFHKEKQSVLKRLLGGLKLW